MFKAALFLARISVSTQNTAGEIAFQFSLFLFKNPKEEKKKRRKSIKSRRKSEDTEKKWRKGMV